MSYFRRDQLLKNIEVYSASRVLFLILEGRQVSSSINFNIRYTLATHKKKDDLYNA